MKTVTATFATSKAAQAAVDALNAADIPETSISAEEIESGGTVVSATVDDGKIDAAAAILKTGASINVEDRDDLTQPTVEGHPDGSGPVVIPLVPSR